ncbi:MAG: SDR family NAD(P)-dependent oxidoreductase [Alphaproteobacteria bacterium]|nr:SDR family NAD(P)-dependent oxidoreductase [Alphaproteobacteria bacterium]MBU1527298.1 SDR family NAD(P)-dependent oxidoreductase [Alphaproteobacteria bacterium]MBU2118140.1 SDR family NAD(P)-dependent oxidoreductase [Alphaproteobacteria bacterium]MBU2349959.1 SDR family NAD(P)-dependent oxidoreductase [Alphaproteobacteria bacterium]MBU2382208.1 SDR family NAD(P)-dependent oxidoreductase [Alphaproteobacteria bacterium]
MQTSAVVIGASGGIGAAVTARLRASGRFALVHALSRSVTGLDLEEEASIAAAAARVSGGPPPSLVFVATGVLHDGQAPERTYRALSADHLLRDYRVNVVGPALVARHFLPLVPRDRPAAFAALSARVGSIGDNRLGGWHAYRASKAALNMILRNLAIELARTHPQAVVAGLHPGTVETALSAPFRTGVAPEKLFTPDYSAGRLLEVLDGLTPAESGSVFAWDGARIPA